jgi:nucleotide-binding universal stress UspA family protein
MSLKNILVYLDSGADNSKVLKHAFELGTAHGARLTGVIARPIPEPNWTLMGEGAFSRTAIADLKSFSVEQSDSALSEFNLALDRSGLKGDTRVQDCSGHSVAEVVSQFLRRHDMALIGQSPSRSHRFGGHELPDDVVMQSGRPVLVVPYIETKPAGKHIMIGWDGSREAARAVNDAMPLLQMAQKVTLLMVNPIPSVISQSAKPGAGIIQHLAAHGIDAQVNTEVSGDMSRDNIILSRVSDLDVDLLVLGAYSTPRYQEIIFGGVTRHLMNEMTVPILFSH